MTISQVQTPAPLERAPARRQRLVIVGNGMAGARLAEEVLARARGAFDITIIGGEPHGNYSRILLSNVLNGTTAASEIFLNPINWYAENGITLLAGVYALGIHRQRKTVMLADGRAIPYDALVLATGSRPFMPQISGNDLYGVFTFRTLDDCLTIAKWARGAQHAAVIGGGLLGLEAAKGLMTHGPAVHVIDINPYLMSAQLNAAGGAVLGRAIGALGVSVHCGKTTAALLEGPGYRVRGVKFTDGSELACDMVVISAGIRANAELARDVGLKVNRAIVVDDTMGTEDPAIFAVGECAEHRGAVYGLVAPLYEQCTVLADRLTGTNRTAVYQGSTPATKLKVMGVQVASLGIRDPLPGDEVVGYQEEGIYQQLIVRGGVLVGATLVGDTGPYDRLQALLRSRTPLPARRSEVLFGTTSQAEDLCDLPDTHQVCDCNGVSKGAIVQAIRGGCSSVAAIGGKTRAGTGCGSCKGRIKELLTRVAGPVQEDPAEHWYVPGVPLAKPALVAEIQRRGLRSVSAVLRELGSAGDPKTRNGLASLLKSLWNEQYVDERDARFINDRVHANIQKDGTFSVVPRIYGGVTSPEELIRIGQVAQKWQVPMVKFTGGQRIDLLGVRKEDLPAIWSDLGMPSGYAYTKAFRTCKTCVGSDFCRFGTNDSIGLGVAIEKRFQGLEFPAKLKMAVSGCPRNCAEATVKDVGVVASEGGEWEIVIGGAAGASVRKADVLARVKTREEALTLIGRFLQYYRENGKWLERTYDFVPRIGLPRLQQILLQDAEGLCERLDRAVQASIDAYVDPWSEGQTPAYAGQFASERSVALPVLEDA